MTGPLLRSTASKLRARPPIPGLLALATVAVCLGGLFGGYEPVGGDPDGMYRPIKSELVRALRNGTLPYWSDRFGLGTPLVAESHAAAFYPPNLVLYRVLSVAAAYRLAIWLHYLALTAATYAYARVLAITPWGSALSALSVALCGFQASHASHEPFYHALPYLPLCLLMAERFMADGKIGWLAGMALAIGAQLTVGHFQIQAWTAGLVVLTGFWRAAVDGRPWRRAVGLAGAAAWGFAVAGGPLALTWELTRISGFDRPIQFLMGYSFPPGHWAQLALPRLFIDFQGGIGDPYWRLQGTTAQEACLYVGTVPLVLAFIGLLARGDRALAPWKLLGAVGFLLATMPRWWPDGYRALLLLPGFGQFRAPGRYTLLTSMGLSLLAGRGFDRLVPAPRFRAGLGLAIVFGIAAFVWGYGWSLRPEVRRALGEDGRALYHLGTSALAWVVAILAVIAWHRGRIGPWGPFALAAVELGFLFYHGPTPWAWSIPIPEGSPALRRLLQEPAVGLVTGRLMNIPVRAGMTTAYPLFGIAAPPPNFLLEPPPFPDPPAPDRVPWFSRFGVSHGVWENESPPFRDDAEVLFLGDDPALNALWTKDTGLTGPHLWRVERYPGAFPSARVALRVREAANWYELYPALVQSRSADRDEVWFERLDRPPDGPGPRARSARLVRWDGWSGEVEHDGTCDLVIRRTYYPGWLARLDDGPELPVTRADGGVQAVRIPGAGRTRIKVRYHPRPLAAGVILSFLAIGSALSVLGVVARRAVFRK